MVSTLDPKNLVLTVAEYRALSSDAIAQATSITVKLSIGGAVVVKSKFGTQSALPAGAK